MKINETLADALNKIDNMIMRWHDWNEESKELGLISDSDKLKIFKGDLYREVRLSNPNQQKILNITGAIGTIEELQHTAHIREQERLKLQLSFPSQIQTLCT